MDLKDELLKHVKKMEEEREKQKEIDDAVDAKLLDLVKRAAREYKEITEVYGDKANHASMLHRFMTNIFVHALDGENDGAKLVDCFDDFMDLIEGHKVKNTAFILLKSMDLITERVKAESGETV